MSANAMTSTQNSRLDALQARHSALSARIEKEQQRPVTGGHHLQALKKQKLVLKEEIEEIRRSSGSS